MKLIKLQENIAAVLIDEKLDKEKILAESKDGKKVRLRVKIEAIHETITKNDIMYSADRLRGDASFLVEGKVRPSGQYSWTRPFQKPMLINHDSYTKPLGRIVEAQYKDKTLEGVPGIEVVVELSDPEAVEMVLDGRYLTVSIGADTDALYCSICNSNIFGEESCNHWKGETYEGQKCHYKAGNLWFSELSFVNKPADEGAKVTGFDRITEGKESQDEFYVLDDAKKAFILIESVQENNEGEEADNMKTKMSEYTPEELAALTPEELAKLEDDISENSEENKDDSEENNENSDNKEFNILESEEYVQLNEQLSALQESHNELLETLLDIVKKSGLIKEDSDPANESNTSADVAEMQEKMNSLEAENQSLQEQVESLTEKNIAYQSQIREDLVEKIVGLRVELGKTTEESIEEDISAYKERSEESLRDTLVDLTREIKDSGKRRTVSRVASPGLVDNSQAGVIDEDEDNKQDKKTKITEQNVFKSLFYGKKEL